MLTKTDWKTPRTGSEILKRLVIGIAVVCLILGSSTAVFAVSPGEVASKETNQIFHWPMLRQPGRNGRGD